MTSVLIVEDEVKLARVIADYLNQAGFDVHQHHEGTGAVELIRSTSPDFVILDLMLPGKDGLDICREVRTFSHCPIMMLTARVDEIDRLLGLELGADDYVCKPFSPREVVARVRSILRRVESMPSANDDGYRGIEVDEDRMTATVGGNPVELTPVEFNLLKALTDQPGRVFSRQNLMQACYDDYRVVSDRTIDSHIKNLRRKVCVVEDGPEINSIYGVGYKLE